MGRFLDHASYSAPGPAIQGGVLGRLILPLLLLTVMRFLLDAAAPLAGEGSLTSEGRDRLRQSLHSARAGQRCSCEECPPSRLIER